MGSLNSPYDFSFYIQNYSFKPLGIIVKAGEEYTFEYQFQVSVIGLIKVTPNYLCIFADPPELRTS